NLFEIEFGRMRQKSRHGGFAGAGRAPENQRAERARLEHAGERAGGAKQMILANDFGQFVGPQLVGKRPRRRAIEARGSEEAGRGLFRTRAQAPISSLFPLAGEVKRNQPENITDICCPPRWMVIRQLRPPAAVTCSRSAGLLIFSLLTVTTTSPF